MIDCFYIFVKVIIRLIKNWREKSFENWIFTKHDLNIWDFRSTPRAHLNYSINISFKKSTTIVSVYRYGTGVKNIMNYLLVDSSNKKLFLPGDRIFRGCR